MQLFERLSTPIQSARSTPGLSVRVLAMVVLAWLAGALFYCRIPYALGPFPIWFVMGLIYSAVLGLTGMLTFIFLPGFGLFVEFVALSRLGVAAVSAGKPAYELALIASPELNANLVVGIAILLRIAYRHQPALRSGKDSLVLEIRDYLSDVRMRHQAAHRIGAI